MNTKKIVIELQIVFIQNFHIKKRVIIYSFKILDLEKNIYLQKNYI